MRRPRGTTTATTMLTTAALLALAACGGGEPQAQQQGGPTPASSSVAAGPVDTTAPAQTAGLPTGETEGEPDEGPLPAVSGAPDAVQGPEWDTVFYYHPNSSGSGFVGVLFAGQLDAQVLSLRRVDESTGEEVWRRELSSAHPAASAAPSPGASAGAGGPEGYVPGVMRDGERALVAVAVIEPATASGITQTAKTGRLMGFDGVTGEPTWGPVDEPRLVAGQDATRLGDGVLVKSNYDSGTVYSTRDGRRLWDGYVKDQYQSVVPDVLESVFGTTGLVTRRSSTSPYAPDLEARELPAGRVLWSGAQLTPPEGVQGRPVLAAAEAGYAAVVWRLANGSNSGLSVVEVATGQTVGALRGVPGGGGGDGEDDADDAVELWLDRSTGSLVVASTRLFGALDVNERRVLWQRTVGEGGVVAFNPNAAGGGLVHGTGATPVVLDARTGEVRASGQFGFPVAMTDGGTALYSSAAGAGTYVAYRRRG